MKSEFLFTIITLISIKIIFTIDSSLSQYNPDIPEQFTIPNDINYQSGSKYSNQSCIMMANLTTEGYTDYLANLDNENKAFPENFCYGIITYNITKPDYLNIVNLNLAAFRLYKRMTFMWTTQNISLTASLDDGCIGYFKNIVCYYYFPACIDIDAGKTYVRILFVIDLECFEDL